MYVKRHCIKTYIWQFYALLVAEFYFGASVVPSDGPIGNQQYVSPQSH